MAIGAANLALGDFLLERLQRERTVHHRADVADLLSADVIEFKNDDIRFTTVHARMRLQIVHDEIPVTILIFDLQRLPLLFEDFRAVMIALLVMLVLARLAVGSVPASLRLGLIELVERLEVAAFAAFLHATIVA